MNYKKITLDTERKSFESIVAMQGDNKSRYIKATIVNKSIPLDLTGCAVKFSAIKPDMTDIFNGAVITNATLGEVEIELTNQTLAVPGVIQATLVILKEDMQLSVLPFFITVIENPYNSNAIESKSEYKALNNALTTAEGYAKELQDASVNLEEKYTTRLNNFGEQLDKKASEIDLAIERNRINNLVNISSGEVDNVEVSDARIGADGKAYNNLGTAIREQFDDVKYCIDSYIKSNIIYYKQYIEVQANNEAYKDYIETFSPAYFSSGIVGVIINNINNTIVPDQCAYIRCLKDEETLASKSFGVNSSNTIVALDIPEGTKIVELRLRCTGVTANTGIAKFTGIKVIDGSETKVTLENSDVVTESQMVEMFSKYKNNFLIFPKELPKLSFNLYYDIDNSINHNYDFSNFRKYTAIYVDPINGNNTNSGFSSSLPWKDLSYAIDKIKASATNEFTIFIVGTKPIFNYSQLPSGVVGLNGKTVAIVPYNQGAEILFTNKLTANFDFTLYQNDIYMADCSLAESNISSIFDLSYKDENDVYIPITKVDTIENIVDYSWCYSNNKIYAKANDIGQLVVNYNNRLLNFCVYNKGVLYLENCNFLTTNSNDSNLLVNGDETGLLVMNNCKCSGGTLLGSVDTGMLRVEDISSYMFNTICAYSKHDGFFYYHHNDTSKIINLEYYCKGYSMGYGSDDTVNCTTAHNGVNIIRIGFEGYDAPSGIVDAIGCKTYCERCDIHDLNNGSFLRGYSVSSNETKGDAYLWIKDCKTRGKMNDGLKTAKSSVNDTNKVFVFLNNFINQKTITYSDNTIVDSF